MATSIQSSDPYRIAADVLTGGRIALTIPLLVATWAAWWPWVMVLLTLAWWSDFYDGRFARRAAAPTLLRDWDLRADTLVGAGIVGGLAAGGHMAVPWAVGGALLTIAYVLLRNDALGMLVQAIAYGHALWFGFEAGTPTVLVAGASVVVIALADVRRLRDFVLPTFFEGLRRAMSGRTRA